MADTVTNELLLETLKAMQGEFSASRERDAEMLRRIGHLETMIARLGRDHAQVISETVDDRHSVDRLKERIERIERRLELTQS